MRKRNDPNDYELRDEYDFSKMTVVAKGRYAPHRRAGKNVILLAPDVAEAFPTEETVNDALRLVIRLRDLPFPRKKSPAKARKRVDGQLEIGRQR